MRSFQTTTTFAFEPDAASLPGAFADWFASRGWGVREHQVALLAAGAERRSTLLIAPTGAGKTLAGFLPSLVELNSERYRQRNTLSRDLHTLYISPLKALAVDVARNVQAPVEEMGLDIKVETRTGDTPVSKRTRQRKLPPDILMTTPEQLALMLSHEHAERLFGSVRTIILDELHSLVVNKRGDLLSLDLARLRKLAPDAVTIGLSATVARPSELRAWLAPQRAPDAVTTLGDAITVTGGAVPEITIHESAERLPWSGHSARHAIQEVYETIKRHEMVLVFVNTRSQAELTFHALWTVNEDALPIALHHGSLEVGKRRKIEGAMVAGALRAVVCTSTLDLGIDWGNVDLVVHMGAPKGASRLNQRIGRANHRMGEPSKALLVPSNRFEVMECQAALDAAKVAAQDTIAFRAGGLDVLAQHVLGMACAGPFDALELFDEVRSAVPYAELPWETFERVVDFVATGGYALRAYEKYARLRRQSDGRWVLSHTRFAQQYRMNAGTIVQDGTVKLRLGRPVKGGSANNIRGGRILGEVEEWYIDQLVPGDTFVFGGEVVRFEGMRETDAFVTKAVKADPKIPSWQGGKFPLSTYIAGRVRAMLSEPSQWDRLPDQVGEWLEFQQKKSVIPSPDEVLVETFPRAQKHYMVCYPFEGRLAHATLAMLLTRRLDRAGARPLGYVCNDYALAIWSLGDHSAMIADGTLSLTKLFDEDMLGDDLDAWLAGSFLMKRTFRYCAVIGGLIERRHPGAEKTGRQVTFSTDLIYDVLKEHEPDHILLQAAWADASAGLLDLGRLQDFLKRIEGRIVHQALERVSPLAVPVMLEIGREVVAGGAHESLLHEAAEDLIADAMGEDWDGSKAVGFNYGTRTRTETGPDGVLSRGQEKRAARKRSKRTGGSKRRVS